MDDATLTIPHAGSDSHSASAAENDGFCVRCLQYHGSLANTVEMGDKAAQIRCSVFSVLP